jgi:hypothetical protein
MIPINNYITEIIYRENLYNIVVFLDFDYIFNEQLFKTYLDKILIENPILKYNIEQKDDIYYWVKNIDIFKIKDFYTIKKVKYNIFNKYTDIILNTKFKTNYKWKFTVLNDNINNKSRIYLKICHSYCDGYKLINILTKPVDPNYSDIIFKRNNTSLVDKLYYIIFGTIMLFIINIKIIWNFTFNQNNEINKNSTNLIKSNDNKLLNKTSNINLFNLNLENIKNVTKKYDITVNDFLYAIMIKTWYTYNKNLKENSISVSSFNINNSPNIFDANNMHFLFIEANGNTDNITLLKNVNHIFNLYKYSLYIPITSTILNSLTVNINYETKKKLYNNVLSNINLSFSNIIGPKLNKNLYNLKNIGFCTEPKSNEICFNIISFENNVKILISFKKRLISNKKHFKKCFKNVYNTFINL